MRNLTDLEWLSRISKLDRINAELDEEFALMNIPEIRTGLKKSHQLDLQGVPRGDHPLRFIEVSEEVFGRCMRVGISTPFGMAIRVKREAK